MFERFTRLSSDHLGDGDLQLAWLNKENFEWLPESDLSRWIAMVLAKGDVDALERLVKAYRGYLEGWAGWSNKDLAKVHMMTACNILWEEGRDRGEVTKGEIQSRAEMLWAGSACRRKHHEATEENIKREEKNLPHVDWPLIRKELGLEDLKPGKAGRKPIGNKKGS